MLGGLQIGAFVRQLAVTIVIIIIEVLPPVMYTQKVRYTNRTVPMLMLMKVFHELW